MNYINDQLRERHARGREIKLFVIGNNENFENFGNCSHDDDQDNEKIENAMHKMVVMNDHVRFTFGNAARDLLSEIMQRNHASRGPKEEIFFDRFQGTKK